MALGTLFTLTISPWQFLEDAPHPRVSTRTAEARPPLYRLSPMTLNCRVGQRCRVAWEQQPGWGWIQAHGRNVKTGAMVHSRTIRKTCVGPRYGWCRFSHTFPRPALNVRWINATGATEGRANWIGKRCFY
jgi:hypothetical protein